MATTAVSSTSSTAVTTPNTTTTSTKTAAAKVISSLGSGSGIDTTSLAQSLADAEISPQKSIVNDRITKAQSRISGYSAIKYVLGNLQSAFKDLKDKSSFVSAKQTSSQPDAVSITATGSADTSNHTIVVNKLATADLMLSNGFASSSAPLNKGEFNLTLTVHSTATPINIPVGKDNPSDIVSLINAKTTDTGVKAQLVNTGESTTPWKIMLTGTTGASNSFTLSSDTPDTVAFVNKQNASNGDVVFDGIPLEPTQNSLVNLIPGTTVSFLAKTTGSGASIGLTRDSTTIKTKLQALVTAYNDANTMLNTVSDPKSTVDTYGATLVGNSLVSTVKTQMREMFLPASVTSNPGGIPPKSLRDLGVSIDSKGTMTLDNTKLDSVLASNYDDVATLMTNNLEGVSTFYTAAAGVAGDATRKLSDMISDTSSLGTQTANQTTSIANYQKDLSKLNDRMTKILARYTQQFAAMDSIVGQTKSLQTSLTSTFAGMSAMYTNK